MFLIKIKYLPKMFEFIPESNSVANNGIAVNVYSGCYKHTELHNKNRIVFEGMSSWTALTWHIGMKTAN